MDMWYLMPKWTANVISGQNKINYFTSKSWRLTIHETGHLMFEENWKHDVEWTGKTEIRKAEITCCQGRKCSAHWRKIALKRGGAPCVWNVFLFHSCPYNLAWQNVHRREVILSCLKGMAVERVVCLVFARWLENRGLPLKFRRHGNSWQEAMYRKLYSDALQA